MNQFILYARMAVPTKDQKELALRVVVSDQNNEDQLKVTTNQDRSVSFVTHLLPKPHYFFCASYKRSEALQMEVESLYLADEFPTTYVCALAVSQEVYNKVQAVENYQEIVKSGHFLTGEDSNYYCNLRQFVFNLQPGEFEVIGFIVPTSNKFSEYHLILNKLLQNIDLTNLFMKEYQEYTGMNSDTFNHNSQTVFFKSDYLLLQDDDAIKEAMLVSQIEYLDSLNTPQSNYQLGMLYNNPMLSIYDQDTSFYYFEKYADYLRASKAILYARMAVPTKDQKELALRVVVSDQNNEDQLKVTTNQDRSVSFVTHLLPKPHYFFYASYKRNEALRMEVESLYLADEFPTTYICALAVNQEVYNKVQAVENYQEIVKSGHFLTGKDSDYYCNLRQFVFNLQPGEFEVIGFIVPTSNKFEEHYLILNELMQDIDLTNLFMKEYQQYAVMNSDTFNHNSRTIFFNSDYLLLQDDDAIKEAMLVSQIKYLDSLNTPQSNYQLGMFYNDPMLLNIYDPDMSFYYFEKCDDYLPALKAILPFYISRIVDEEDNINPLVFAKAEQVAASIITHEPDHEEANTFLEREKKYGKSITITEKFNSLVGLPLKSMMFIGGNKVNAKNMYQTLLFDRKSQRNDKYAQDRDQAQHEWDRNYGLIIKP